MPAAQNFIRQIIDADIESGKYASGADIVTRFPPEPNGYLHIGHAKSILLNFGIAADYGGKCTLRYDDTNPAKENMEFVKAIEQDVRWLGCEVSHIAHASDYFLQLHDFAVRLIDKGLAYADSQTAEQIRATRGTLTEAGVASPHRARTVAENRDLFARMRAGEFADGEMVLRAKIDMAAANLNLRDPVIYRIRKQPHQRSGDDWCIYPMYDFAHALSDAIEGVTHSLCTLEFEDHRPLYDWFVDNVDAPSKPRQYEFARLNLSASVMSKRLLTQLVDARAVDGWDDPRLPTICGLRRRGYTPAALRDFIESAGVTKKNQTLEIAALEHSIRRDLEARAPRRMAVLRPLKVVITNLAAEQTLRAPNHPADPSMGERTLRIGREIFIEQDDFMLDAPRKFFRLAPGREVRLRYAFAIRCVRVIEDAGEVCELHCEYDPATQHGAPDADTRKIKGVIHWVNASDAVDAEVRLFDRLFLSDNPGGDDLQARLNPNSLRVHSAAKLEASLADADTDARFQFERLGYFCRDSKADKLIFNRSVTLRDSWAKAQVRAKPVSTGDSDAL